MTPAPSADPPSPARRWSGKALLAVGAWGVSFVATRIALETFTPTGLVAVRLAVGAAALAAIARWAGRPVLPAREDRGVCLALGAILGVHLLIQAVALRYTSAINSSWIIAFSPVPIAIGSWIFLRQRLAASGWIGVTLATGGIALIVASATPGFAAARTGDALIVVSCLTWAIYSLLGAEAVARSGALRVTLPSTAIGAVVPGVACAWSGILAGPLTARAIVATAFLGLVCTGIGFWLWYSAVREHGAARTGSYLYLEPFVTVAASALLLREPITAPVIGGGILVLIGVWSVARGTFAPAAPPE